MSNAIVKKTALSDREIDFLDRVHTAANLLAMPGISQREAVEKFIEIFPETDELLARKWLKKGREYIDMGVPADAPVLRARYAAKLRALIDRAGRYLVTDEVEITTEDDPTGPPLTADQVKAGEATNVRRSVKKKTRPNVFHPQVANLIAKLMKEEAVVTGARPKDDEAPRGPTTLIQNNNQTTLHVGASRTADLSNEELMRLAGLDGVKVLPRGRHEVEDPNRQPAPEEVGGDSGAEGG